MSEPTPASPHLLVVEAARSLGLVLHDALAEMGYASTLVSSLQYALRVLNQQPFDLIVADTAPSTGPDALVPLRPLLALSHPLPVVLCSAWPPSKTDLRQEGFAGWVEHPFTLDQLVTTVAACLNQPWRPAQLPQQEVAQRFVAAFSQRDIRALAALCTEEVGFYPCIVPPYPHARPVLRREAVRAYLEEAAQYLGAYQVKELHLYPCPHGVAVRLLLRWHDPSGVVKQQMVGGCAKFTQDN